MKKINKSLLSIIFVFFSIPIHGFSQVTDPGEAKLGIFEFSIPLPLNWSSGSSSLARARDILSIDQIQLPPSFAFETSKGGVIFGTWKELKPGIVFTASQLYAEPPAIPQSWGIKKENLVTFKEQLSSGLEYSAFGISGLGDGKSFIGLKRYKTYGLWIDVPVTYKDSSGLHSGLASLYFRGPEIESAGPNGGVKILQKILTNIKVNPNVTLISTEHYKAEISSDQKFTEPKKAAAVITAPAEKNNPAPEQNINSTNATQNSEPNKTLKPPPVNNAKESTESEKTPKTPVGKIKFYPFNASNNAKINSDMSIPAEELYKAEAKKSESPVSVVSEKKSPAAIANTAPAADSDKTSQSSALNNSNFKDLKFNPPSATGVLYNEKGTVFCYNYGVVVIAPCSIVQPGSNMAEISSDLISQINSAARPKK